MSDSGRSMDVLKKILKAGEPLKKSRPQPEELIEKYLAPVGSRKILKEKLKSPGRPKVEDHLKARNFTLCLAPKYLAFLDCMQVKEKKLPCMFMPW